MKTYVLLWQYLADVSDKCCTENKTHFLFSITFLRQSGLFMRYSTERQATHDNMAHALCMLAN
jgi:hypothetical protein